MPTISANVKDISSIDKEASLPDKTRWGRLRHPLPDAGWRASERIGIVSKWYDVSDASPSTPSSGLESDIEALKDEINASIVDSSSEASDPSNLKTLFANVKSRMSDVQTAIMAMIDRRALLCENLGLAIMTEFYSEKARAEMAKLKEAVSEYGSASSESSGSMVGLLKTMYQRIVSYEASPTDQSLLSKIASDAENVRQKWESDIASAERAGRSVPSVSVDSSFEVTASDPRIATASKSNVYILTATVSSHSLIGQTADVTIFVYPGKTLSSENLEESSIDKVYLTSRLLGLNAVEYTLGTEAVLLMGQRAVYLALLPVSFSDDGLAMTVSKLYFNPYWFFGTDTRWSSTGSVTLKRDALSPIYYSGSYSISSSDSEQPPFEYSDTIEFDSESFSSDSSESKIADTVSFSRKVMLQDSSTASMTVSGTLSYDSGSGCNVAFSGPSGFETFHGTLTTNDLTLSKTTKETVYMRIARISGGYAYDIVSDASSTISSSHSKEELIRAAVATSGYMEAKTSESSSSESASVGYAIAIQKAILAGTNPSVSYYAKTSPSKAEEAVLNAIASCSKSASSLKSSISGGIKNISDCAASHSAAVTSLKQYDGGYDDSLVSDALAQMTTALADSSLIPDVSSADPSGILSDEYVQGTDAALSLAATYSDSAIVSICSQIKGIERVISDASVFLSSDYTSSGARAAASMGCLTTALTGGYTEESAYDYSGGSFIAMPLLSDEKDYGSWSQKAVDLFYGTDTDASILFSSKVLSKCVLTRSASDPSAAALSDLAGFELRKLLTFGGISGKLISESGKAMLEQERSLAKKYGLEAMASVNATRIPYAILTSLPGSSSLSSIDIDALFADGKSIDDVKEAMRSICEACILGIKPESVNESAERACSAIKKAASGSLTPRSMYTLLGMIAALKDLSKAIGDGKLSAYYPASASIDSLSWAESAVSDAYDAYKKVWDYFYFIQDGSVRCRDISESRGSVGSAFVEGSAIAKLMGRDYE